MMKHLHFFEKIYIYSHVMTGWEVAGEYVYTTPGDQDVDNQMLTLQVPGYRSEISLNWGYVHTTFGRTYSI